MELKLEASKQNLFEMSYKFLENNCLRCFATFRILLNPKRTCRVCNSNVCKKCSLFINSYKTGESKTTEIKNKTAIICYFCYKQKFVD